MIILLDTMTSVIVLVTAAVAGLDRPVKCLPRQSAYRAASFRDEAGLGHLGQCDVSGQSAQRQLSYKGDEEYRAVDRQVTEEAGNALRILNGACTKPSGVAAPPGTSRGSAPRDTEPSA